LGLLGDESVLAWLSRRVGIMATLPFHRLSRLLTTAPAPSPASLILTNAATLPPSARASSGDEHPQAVRRRQEPAGPSHGDTADGSGGSAAVDTGAASGSVSGHQRPRGGSADAAAVEQHEMVPAAGASADGSDRQEQAGGSLAEEEEGSSADADEKGGRSSEEDGASEAEESGEDEGGREPQAAHSPATGGPRRRRGADAAVDTGVGAEGRDFVIGTFSGHRNARTVKVRVGDEPQTGMIELPCWTAINLAAAGGHAPVSFARPTQDDPWTTAFRAHPPPAPKPLPPATQGVSFFGADDEYVVSGSDDGHVYIWSKVRSSEGRKAESVSWVQVGLGRDTCLLHTEEFCHTRGPA
jgi:hypothetical protein